MVLRELGHQLAASTLHIALEGVCVVVGSLGFCYYTWKIYRGPQCDNVISDSHGIPISAEYCRVCGTPFRTDISVDDIRRRGKT